MKKAIKATLDVLQARGHRLTQARREVVCTLAKLSSPVSIQVLAKQVGADEASVYRTIALLREEGLAEELRVAGQPALYALRHHHHDHAVCKSCGLVAHVPCTLKRNFSGPVSGFTTITSHEVTWYGLCAKCA